MNFAYFCLYYFQSVHKNSSKFQPPTSLQALQQRAIFWCTLSNISGVFLTSLVCSEQFQTPLKVPLTDLLLFLEQSHKWDSCGDSKGRNTNAEFLMKGMFRTSCSFTQIVFSPSPSPLTSIQTLKRCKGSLITPCIIGFVSCTIFMRRLNLGVIGDLIKVYVIFSVPVENLTLSKNVTFWHTTQQKTLRYIRGYMEALRIARDQLMHGRRSRTCVTVCPV
jgi:hypothetical protein